MTDSLLAAKAATESALDTAARPFFCDGRWGVYRAIEAGDKLPRAVQAAFDAHHDASMRWARARGLA